MIMVHKILLPLIFMTTTAGNAVADQQHIVDPSELAATAAQHLAAQDADRAAIREALTHPEVRSIAASMGISLDRAAAAADTLVGSDLEQAATAAKQVNEQLVGGASTVTISTTTIIIILLLVILLVVAIK